MGKQRLANCSNARKNILQGKSDNKKVENKVNQTFCISFKDFDDTQGQTFDDWEKDGILADSMKKLREYCREPLRSQLSNTFKEYGAFPEKSDFHYPKHIPDDVNWASLHITGVRVIAGYIFENTFYIVFLDKEHQFYKVEKKHT